MTDQLREKLKTLPAEPGVYFHRNADRKIIYIGKAAILKNRVMSYFQNKQRDPKTQLLVAEIADTEWITVGSEVEALFLESEFIKRYKPRYNIDLKDDKNFLYVKVSADEFPVVSYVRRPMDDRAHYYGPFTSTDALRRAMRLLRKVFPYVTHANWPKRGCLQYHLGLCPGPEEGAITAIDYRKSIRRLEMYLKGEQTKLSDGLERDMQRAAKKHDFEAAARLRDQLHDLRSLGRQMIFGDREAFDLSRDQALVGLADRLQLRRLPRRIEAFDISHLSGTDNVASMVVFTDGVANRDEYRRFKMRTPGNDDYAHIREVMERRFSSKNLQDWPKPDLLLIDGGQGQLAAALSVLDQKGISIPAIGLAKREEEIVRRPPGRSDLLTDSPFDGTASRAQPDVPSAGSAGIDHGSGEDTDARSLPSEEYPAKPAEAGHWDNEAWVMQHNNFESILLPKDSHVLQLLQRVRDEAHRFAITYQSLLRGKRQTHSTLDDIPGVGPATRKQLIRRFGSLRGVRQAAQEELAAVVGPAKARAIKEALGETPAPSPTVPAPDPVLPADDMAETDT